MRALLVDMDGVQVGWLLMNNYEEGIDIIMFKRITYIRRMLRADIYDEGKRLNYWVYQETAYVKVVNSELRKTPPV